MDESRQILCKIPVGVDFEDFCEISMSLCKIYNNLQGVHLVVDYDQEKKDILVVRLDE